MEDLLLFLKSKNIEAEIKPTTKIMLSENISDSVIKLRKEKFSAMKLQTKGFIFNREEAHERWSFY